MGLQQNDIQQNCVMFCSRPGQDQDCSESVLVWPDCSVGCNCPLAECHSTKMSWRHYSVIFEDHLEIKKIAFWLERKWSQPRGTFFKLLQNKMGKKVFLSAQPGPNSTKSFCNNLFQYLHKSTRYGLDLCWYLLELSEKMSSSG